MWRIVNFHTCSDDVKDARYSLLTDPVRGVAKQRPVVEFRHGSVRDDAGRPGADDVRRGHIDAVRRIVEHPTEMDVGRIRVYLAPDLGLLLLRHAVHSDLIRFAGRGD